MPPPPLDQPSEPESRARAILARAERLRQSAQDYVDSKLVFNNLFRATSYLRSALWTIPILAIVMVLVLTPVLRFLDGWVTWRLTGLTVAGAQTLYETVITLTLSFLVFTFGSLLVAIQVASVNLTPRIIATTLLRDNVVRFTVGLFVFSLLFAVIALDRLQGRVHEAVTLLTAVLGIACLTAFLFLIDHAARLLRPVSILARVGNDGQDVIASVYPNESSETPDVADARDALPPEPRRVFCHTGTSEIVLAFDLATLVREARRADGVVEIVPQVGELVSAGEPLIVLYGGATAIADRTLRTTVAFGSERTMEQDPLFAFRILVDIALKALSPAINDPTTAVLALDQVHRLLRAVGKRRLSGETITDRMGRARVIYRTPNWEDYVHLSCTEIRACGAGSVQVARRLRALLDNLVASLPRHRHAALDQQRRLLDGMLDQLYPQPGDLALARRPDPQGLGGSTRAQVP